MNSSRLFAFLILLSVVLGCSRERSNENGKVHIKLVHFYLDQKDTWQHDVVEPFMRAHPAIDVEVEAVPFGLYTTKILAAAASGSPVGDVVVIDDWFGQELFRRDYTIPLDSLFHRDLKEN